MNKSVNVIVDKKSEKPINKILNKHKDVEVAFYKTIPKLRQNPTLGQQIQKSKIPHEIYDRLFRY